MPPVVPFYSDWQWWSALAAFAALVLSQFPPLLPRLRRGRLSVDVHSQVHLGHELGHTNVQLVIGLKNEGGRDVRVKAITVGLQRQGAALETIAARSYFETRVEKSAVLFVPFTLVSGEESWQNYWFFKYLGNADDRVIRDIRADVRNDIWGKVEERRLRDPNSRELVEVEPALATRVAAHWREQFSLHPGEYVLEVQIDASDPKISTKTRYRLALFESDVAEFVAIADDYKYGFGISNDARRPRWVARPLTPI